MVPTNGLHKAVPNILQLLHLATSGALSGSETVQSASFITLINIADMADLLK